jgi:hypothetical protein
MRFGAIRQLLAAGLLAIATTGAFADARPQGGPADTVKERLDPVLEKDLPKPVADAMHSHRRAVFVSAVKVTRDGKVMEYRLTVKGSRKTAMVAKPDGTVVSFK